MNCASNCEDTNFDMQVGTNEQTEGKCDPALTESSSSFDGDGTSFGEAEVDPELYDDALSAFPFSDLLPTKKKKLTSKWRRYIGPLMWRCKWVELQIKKFESQARKYDREIAEYNGRKQSDNCISENVNSKSLSFSGKSLGNVAMKRKKRRRVEDTEDTVSYMSQHNLFSYFENKKSATADAACAADGNWVCQGAGADKTVNGSSELGFDEELQSCEFNDDESNLLEQIFWKIGLMQWKVGSMKTRVHKVLSENASRLCSSENLSLLVSSNKELTSSTEYPVSSVNNKDKIAAPASPVSMEIVADNKDTKMVDLTMPKSAALRIGEVNNVAEDMKSINLPKIGGSSNPSGTILMYNRRSKMNQNKSKTEPNEDHEGGSSSIVPSSEAPESSTVKIRSISKLMTTSTAIGTTCNKRKRAMRKAGFGKWTH